MKAHEDRLWRYRGVLCVVGLLIAGVLLAVAFLPRPMLLRAPKYDPSLTLKDLQSHHEGGNPDRFAVVLDAGSTGSRVHVFRFQQGNQQQLMLVSDTFHALKPGLSSYADDPAKAAESLMPLLDRALQAVPQALQARTPVSLRATAGLRLLPGAKAEKILQAVRGKLQAMPFKLAGDGVSIMDGKDEGAFVWLTLNYLLGKLGGSARDTVAAVDLGGGSVQEAFALGEEQAAGVPQELRATLHAASKTYNVYVHSYLGYGLMAARAKVVEAAGAPPNGTGSQGAAAAGGHPCYGKGSEQVYEYAGKSYTIKPLGEVADHRQCLRTVTAALRVEQGCGAQVPKDECTFSGVRRGKQPENASYYISSYLWDRAFDTGIITDDKAITWSTAPMEFAAKAQEVCGTAGDEAVLATYPRASKANAGHLCVDMTYCSQLLVAGFKLPPTAKVTLVKQIDYNGQKIEAAWPLGAAINDLSTAA